MFEILNFWNRMIWNHLRHNGMKNTVHRPLEQHCEHHGQMVLEVLILLERLSVLCTVRRIDG